MQTSLKKELSSLVRTPVKWDCPLAAYTSFNIGGPAEALLVVEEEGELQSLLQLFAKNEVRWRVIGKGTNLLVHDDGFAGVVLVLGKSFKGLKQWEDKASGRMYVQVGCAMGLTRLSRWCVERGFGGLEFASGIPGTVGGGVIMNAGAWGRAMADVIHTVSVITAHGRKTVTGAELDFGYRCWRNHKSNEEPQVVIEIVVELIRGDRLEMQKNCLSYLEKRMQNQPQKVPNAGSIFKNPSQDSAGRLIEVSDLKGLQVGGAMVSPLHGNFIVNNGHATAADVLELIKLVKKRVKKDSNVDLEPEVHFL